MNANEKSIFQSANEMEHSKTANEDSGRKGTNAKKRKENQEKERGAAS
jgi:hypothetical protein